MYTNNASLRYRLQMASCNMTPGFLKATFWMDG